MTSVEAATIRRKRQCYKRSRSTTQPFVNSIQHSGQSAASAISQKSPGPRSTIQVLCRFALVLSNGFLPKDRQVPRWLSLDWWKVIPRQRSPMSCTQCSWHSSIVTSNLRLKNPPGERNCDGHPKPRSELGCGHDGLEQTRCEAGVRPAHPWAFVHCTLRVSIPSPHDTEQSDHSPSFSPPCSSVSLARWSASCPWPSPSRPPLST